MPPRNRVPAVPAAVAGLLAVGAALGAGHMVAGLALTPDTSPFFAVGNAAIDRTPAPVKDFAIDTFATNDKLALLVGMAVALALIDVVIGLISRRNRWPGVAAIAVLGAVGVAAVGEQSDAAIGVLAPVASIIVGVVVFWWLHRWARPQLPRGDDAVPDASPLGTHGATVSAPPMAESVAPLVAAVPDIPPRCHRHRARC